MPNITTNHAITYTNLFAVIHGLQILSNEINKKRIKHFGRMLLVEKHFLAIPVIVLHEMGCEIFGHYIFYIFKPGIHGKSVTLCAN